MISLFEFSKIAFRVCRQRWNWWWNRDRINQLQDDVWLALRDGQIATAVLLLEEQLQSFQWPFQIESLLFKRDSRPESLSVTLELLECLWRSKHLLAHQSFYAGIAMAHSALLAGDDVRLGVLRPWLESAAALDVLNVSFKSERLVRNRESPFKQCVSARCCLLQCCFAEKPPDKACIAAIGRASLRLLEQFDSAELSADVLYRSSSHLVRGLLALPLQPPELESAELQLKRLHSIIQQPRFVRSRQRAQENHANLISQALRVVNLANDHRLNAAASLRLTLIINSEASDVRRGAEIWSHQLESS